MECNTLHILSVAISENTAQMDSIQMHGIMQPSGQVRSALLMIEQDAVSDS